MGKQYAVHIWDKVVKQRGARNTMLMLFHQLGDFNRKGELKKMAENFLLAAEKVIYLDVDKKLKEWNKTREKKGMELKEDKPEVTQIEFEGIINELEDDDNMDFVTAVLGTLTYQFKGPKHKFKRLTKVLKEHGQSKLPPEHLAVIGSNLIRYFMTRVCEMSEEIDILATQSLYRVWRAGRGIRRIFTKSLNDQLEKNYDTQTQTFKRIKKIGVGQRTEAETLNFYMSQIRRGVLLGGLRPKSCMNQVINLCRGFRTAKDSFKAVMRMGKWNSSFLVSVRGKDGVDRKKKQRFDMTRFLVGYNELIHHKEALANDPKLKKSIQVFVAQLLYITFIRLAFHFRMAGLAGKKSPSYIGVRNLRIGLKGLFGITFDQLQGYPVPILEETPKESVYKTKVERPKKVGKGKIPLVKGGAA